MAEGSATPAAAQEEKILDVCLKKVAAALKAEPKNDACVSSECIAADAFRKVLESIKSDISSMPADKKSTAEAAFAALQKGRTDLAKALADAGKPAHDSMLKDTPRPPPAFDALETAKAVCTMAADSIAAQLAAQAATINAAQSLGVCRDKMEKLPDFLARYYTSVSRNTKTGLKIERARYGDIINEDREYRRSQGFSARTKHQKTRNSGTVYESGPINVETPRASINFTAREDREDGVTIDWNRHRHSCDVSWFFRLSCQPKAYTGASPEDSSGAGPGHCIIKSDNLGSLCGYDPSPQGSKQIHVWYTCNGSDRSIKLPGNAKRVNIICNPDENDLFSLRKYFESDPCKVPLPDVVVLDTTKALADAAAAKAAADAAAAKAAADAAKAAAAPGAAAPPAGTTPKK